MTSIKDEACRDHNMRKARRQRTMARRPNVTLQRRAACATWRLSETSHAAEVVIFNDHSGLRERGRGEVGQRSRASGAGPQLVKTGRSGRPLHPISL
eukprot:1585749-Pyramimonas_sp.AAC.1